MVGLVFVGRVASASERIETRPNSTVVEVRGAPATSLETPVVDRETRLWTTRRDRYPTVTEQAGYAQDFRGSLSVPGAWILL